MALIEVTIPNWSKYNPRTDRSVHSWFRFQNNFFADQKLWTLSDEQRLLFIFLLCEVSQSLGGAAQIETDYAVVMLKSTPSKITNNLQILARLGVINPPIGGELTPNGNATNVTNERNERTGKCKPDGLPRLAKIWNENCGEKLAKVKATNAGRTRKSDLRFVDLPEDEWVFVVKRIAASEFCCGSNERGWKATFDWLLQPDTHLRVTEGKYDNREGVKKGSADADATKILKGIKRFGSNESKSLQEFLGEELFKKACRVPGGISGIRQLPNNDFTVKKLTGLLLEVTKE